jgi:VWFA-related protein
MTAHSSRSACRIFGLAGLPAALLVLSATFAAPAQAAVELRVEGRPMSAPIQAFVKVTDANGDPVPNLDEGDFTIEIDGAPIIIADGDLTLPPSLDPNQRVSVVFAMDYSASVVNQFEDEMQAAVIAFIDAMVPGDHAAVVKFNATNPAGASVVVPFTEIDDGGANDAALIAGVQADYPGNGTNMADALLVALEHLDTPPAALPEGPKAVILIGDGSNSDGTATVEEVIAQANADSIPIFTIGIGEFSGPGRLAALTDLGEETGGAFFPAPTTEDIDNAYVTVGDLLNNEYFISIANGITDCAAHELEVEVNGESASAIFTRRTCDTEPNPFSFTTLTGRAPGTGATSNEVTIEGIEVPAHISVIGGNYSIGCTDTFVSDPDEIEDGETVCLRHQSSDSFSTDKTTTLTVGGFAATFTSTTRADDGGGGGGGGGGGALGLVALLGLGGLLLARRRVA